MRDVFRDRAGLAITAIAMSFVCLALAPRATAYVYWTNFLGGIDRANINAKGIDRRSWRRSAMPIPSASSSWITRSADVRDGEDTSFEGPFPGLSRGR